MDESNDRLAGAVDQSVRERVQENRGHDFAMPEPRSPDYADVISNEDLVFYLDSELNDKLQNGEISEGTFKKKLQHLRWFYNFLVLNDLNIAELEYGHVYQMGKELKRKYSASTAGSRLRAVGNFFDWLLRQGDIEENPFVDLSIGNSLGISESESKRSHVLREQGKRGRLKPSEIEAMVENVPNDHKLLRQLIILIAYETGARREELIQIKEEHVYLEDSKSEIQNLDDEDYPELKEAMDDDAEIRPREIYLPDKICKFNRGGKVAISRRTATLLRDWLEREKPNLSESQKESEYIFPSPRGKTHIKEDFVTSTVDRAAQAIGIQSVLYTDANGYQRKQFTPHSLRYSCGYYRLYTEDDEIRENSNLYEVSNYLRHKSISTTERTYIEENQNSPVDSAKGFFSETHGELDDTAGGLSPTSHFDT